jgi:hypothetical protein
MTGLAIEPTGVIPEILQGLSGTHEHSPIRIGSRVWVPVFACRETGMTRGVE